VRVSDSTRLTDAREPELNEETQVLGEGLADEEVVTRVLAGETPLYEIVMRRYNQRLYRVARAILGSDAEAEDVVQDAYVRAYANLSQFEGRARFSTWLTKIAVYEALLRRQRAGRLAPLETEEVSYEDTMPLNRQDPLSPEDAAYSGEIQTLLEETIDALPQDYRAVFMLREIEEMSTSETAESLGLSEENVKVRLHRARTMLREGLYSRVGAVSLAAFQFPAPRCNRVVEAVFKRIAQSPKLRLESTDRREVERAKSSTNKNWKICGNLLALLV
jgi:RNA polymerase sigma-70 factor (ECF subfamily)